MFFNESGKVLKILIINSVCHNGRDSYYLQIRIISIVISCMITDSDNQKILLPVNLVNIKNICYVEYCNKLCDTTQIF